MAFIIQFRRAHRTLQNELPQFERAVWEKLFRRKANPLPLKRVFVGGSKTFSERSHLTFRALDAFCLANCEMLISDMQGVGVAVLEYLKRREYVNVRVCPERKTDEAINRCDFGVAYLDGFTRDTAKYIENLLSIGIPCYVQKFE